MRAILLFAALGCALAAPPDPREIVRRSVEAFDGKNAELALGYNFFEHVVTRKLDGNGGVKSVSSKTHDILMIEGTPYRRLLSQDGKPLPEEEEKAQLESLKLAIEERRNETRQEHAKRLEEYEKRRTRYQKAIKEIPDAFHFRLLGEETIGTHPVWVIEATPRPGYQPVDRYSKLYTQLKGKLWIHKTGYQWVRMEAELLDPVWFGWILVRIGKGAKVKMEQMPVDEGVWVPRRTWFTVSLRIGLVKAIHTEQEATYSNYRPRHADSILAASAVASSR